MRLLNHIYLLAFLVLPFEVLTQKTLSFEDYKTRVLNYHPVVKQASIVNEIGQKEVLKARGQLDPSISSSIQSKEFNGKEYYNLSNTGLKIPTWLGIDLKAGYEINRGDFLSEQNSTPSSGLWYAGIEVPLGQGLLFDERRAIIKSALIFEKNSANEQVLMLNDLLLDAYSTYWLWLEAYQELQVTNEGLTFARIRFEGVKENHLQGEVPAIDTVEAKIQLDSRRYDYNERLTTFNNMSLLLNLYLWSDDFIPLELDENTIPLANQTLPRPSEVLTPFAFDSLQNNLPFLLKSMYKLEMLQIEERLKKENLKPQLNVSYNPISQPIGNNPFSNFSPNNYKFGFSAYMPLFLRKERGSLAQTKLKIEATELEINVKAFELATKEKTFRNEIALLLEQIEIQTNQVSQARQLRDSEQIRFETGESSLFLVNARELTYLSYQLKLIELQTKLRNTNLKRKWLFSELL
jgi:outer membrane protein TolC